MAILQRSNGTTLENIDSIALELAHLSVAIRSIPLELNDKQVGLLSADILDESAKRQLLSHPALSHPGMLLVGCADVPPPLWWDLLNLHPGSSQLPMLITTYDRYHTHGAPESFYVVSGSAIVGFVNHDGTQMRLLVQPQDYLYIPANVEHWFSPTAGLSLKAIRYFTNVEGWVPQYTGTPIGDITRS